MADVLTTQQVLQCFIADMRRQGPVLLAHLLYPLARRSAVELAALTITLQAALQAGGLLHLRYQAGNAAETSRTVQPLEMCYERGHGYLRAFCHLRQGERHFRLDRIVELRLLTPDG
jgi:predicted DNA-binding transcriptional regulator YafY